MTAAPNYALGYLNQMSGSHVLPVELQKLPDIENSKPENETILIVDDQQYICELFIAYLEKMGYKCFSANDGYEALGVLENNECSLVLSDMDMPNMNGVKLLEEINYCYPQVAVMMVSGADDRELAVECIKKGAYGYIAKPVGLDELHANVTGVLHRRNLEIINRIYSQNLESLVAEKTQALDVACQETLMILSRSAEFRDNDTGYHNKRMGMYCEFLARKAGLPEKQYRLIGQASPLHDVGKIGIADDILLKPGRLTEKEFTEMKKHSEIGYRILAESNSDVLRLASVIALTHHERYDGKGYPRGLKENEIPIEGRIASICDVFDALTSERVYKKAMSMDQATEIMVKERGRQFCPKLLDLFLDHIDEIKTIRLKYIDDIETSADLL